MKLNFDALTSKTIWGTIIALVGFLTQPNVLAVLPQKVAAIIGAVGVILAAVGARDAIAKSGPTP